MKRVERLTAEVLLLQERARTAEEMAGCLQVSRRTIIRDVQSLCEIGVPILSREGAGGGYRLAEHFKLPPLHLTTRESTLLLLALECLESLSDSPFRTDRHTLAAKIRSIVPVSKRTSIEATLDVLQLEVPRRSRKAPMLDSLILCAGKWLQLSYEAATSEELIGARLDRIYSDRGHWYAACTTLHGRRFLRVDHIKSAIVIEPPESFREPLPYSHPSHPLVKVQLNAISLRILEREPHLGPLVEGRTDEEVCLEFRCPPEELNWYAKYFGGMGTNARVLEPDALISMIKAGAKELADHYS